MSASAGALGTEIVARLASRLRAPAGVPPAPRYLRRGTAATIGAAAASPAAATLPAKLLLRRYSAATIRLAARRLAALPCFSAQDYAASYPDVASDGMNPARHALLFGIPEQRRLFDPRQIARALGAPAPSRLDLAAPAPARGVAVAVHVSSVGNVFMRDIARDLVDCLTRSGVEAMLRDETAPRAPRPPVCVYVAPHEFFLLGRGPDWVRDDVVARGVMLNTEQPQTQWFARALPFLLAGRAVLDLSPHLAAQFDAAGIPAADLALLPPAPEMTPDAAVLRHPLFHALPETARRRPDPATPFAARAIDVAFFGAQTPHRDAWFARNAAMLAEHRNFLYSRRAASGPLSADGQDGALSALAWHVCTQARIVLNLHRDAFATFEWHRIVRLGLAAGGVVVTEPCPPHPIFEPDVHFLAAPARHLPELIEWLLCTPDGHARARAIQLQAAQTLATQVEPQRVGAALHAFLAGLPG